MTLRVKEVQENHREIETMNDSSGAAWREEFQFAKSAPRRKTFGGDPRRSVMRSRGKGEQASQPEIETIKDLSGTAWREGCLNLPAIGSTRRARA